MPTLNTLLEGMAPAEVLSAAGAETVSGVCDDSRQVTAGSVFVAVRGDAVDGRQFIPMAVERGARVVVGEALEPIDGVIAVSVADARRTLAELAQRWYRLRRADGFDLKLLAITGTNGKSTTATMTRAILEAAGLRCGLIGTTHYDLCSRSVKASLTTPGTLELASYLRECADAGAQAVVMEASSHALDQQRTAGLPFTAAAFTNLTQDHLDYHGTMEHYAAAKARLFAALPGEATAVINADDPWHQEMIKDCAARVLTFGMDHDADLNARIRSESIHGTLYRLTLPEATLGLENAIVGRHNVYNALAAAGLALAAGASPREIEAGLASVRNIPGRLQRVPGVGPADVFVDYAHTDDALRNVLAVLKPLTKGKLIVVFGAGGDRDRGKRPKMAQAAAGYADAIVVTSDNPRTEDPHRIIDDILEGFEPARRRSVIVEPDRRLAITCALAGAHEGDVVLIAGKGHEDYQILGTERIHFDDVEVAIAAAAELAQADGSGGGA